jgi:hypothetical protein
LGSVIPAIALVKPNKSIPSVDKGKPQAPKTEADRALLEAMKGYDRARAEASGVVPTQ